MTTRRDIAEHYYWGDACEGWHLVKEDGLSVIEERMPPGTAEARHYHRAAEQFFYILSGEAQMEVNGEICTLRRGEGIHIPPGRRHQIRNVSSAPVEFLVVSRPPSHGDRVIE